MFVRNGLTIFANRSERTRRTLRKGEVRFNGRISDVLTPNHFDSALDGAFQKNVGEKRSDVEKR